MSQLVMADSLKPTGVTDVHHLFAGVVSVILDLLDQWLSAGPAGQSTSPGATVRQSVPRWLDAVLLVIDAIAQAQPPKESLAATAAAAAALPHVAQNGAAPAGATPPPAGGDAGPPVPGATQSPGGAGNSQVRPLHTPCCRYLLGMYALREVTEGYLCT